MKKLGAGNRDVVARNNLRLRLLALAVLLLLAACDGTRSTPSAPAETRGNRVGMALGGPRNDKGYNQSHYEGLVRAQQELGVKTSVLDNLTDPQGRIDALQHLSADNDLVIAVGAEFAEAGTVVAPEFPRVTFMVINGQPSTAPNLHVFGVRQGVPAYVAGVVAAAVTRSNKVGYLGGDYIPPTIQANDGFKAGVVSTKPSVRYASIIVGSFNDAAKAKEAARAQIAGGADMLFALISDGLPGVLQAVAESGKDVKVFSVVVPRCQEFPQIVGTGILDSAGLVHKMVSQYQTGSIPKAPKYYGIEDPTIQRFELCPRYASPKLQELVDTTVARINSGAVKLPRGV